MYPIVVILALVACAIGTPSPPEVTIDAAVRYDDIIILIVGDEYMAIGSDGTEQFMKKRTGGTHVPVDKAIRSAVRISTSSPYVNYYGDSTQYVVKQTAGTMKIVPYDAQAVFLKGGAPDAAVFLSDSYLVMKGCDVVATRHPTVDGSQPSKLDSLGLPCDIDAAWTSKDGNVATFLKGDQIWTLDYYYNVKGPLPFASIYTIHSWKLLPNPDLRYQL